MHLPTDQHRHYMRRMLKYWHRGHPLWCVRCTGEIMLQTQMFDEFGRRVGLEERVVCIECGECTYWSEAGSLVVAGDV